MPEVLMPRLSDTMEEGTLSQWIKHQGDEVHRGDVVAVIETDKAAMDLEAYDDGVLDQLLVEEGTSVPIGTPIAVIDGQRGAPAAAPAPAPAAAPAAPPVPAPVPSAPAAPPSAGAAPPAAPQAPAPSAEGVPAPVPGAAESAGAPVAAPAPPAVPEGRGPRVPTSPLARALARRHGIDLATLAGTGPGGRIVRADVDEAIRQSGARPAAAPAAPPAAPAPSRPGAAPSVVPPPGPAPAAPPAAVPPTAGRPAAGPDVEELPLTQVRRLTAERLTASMQQAPHFYLTRTADVGALLEFRAGLNARPGADIKVSVTDLLVKACAATLAQHPEVNSSWAGTALLRHRRVHIGVAVAIEEGLIVPVVRDADRKSLTEIAREAHDLATRARIRRLAPDEITGSTFSISNLGMYGIEHFTAVINPPEAAILAVGAVTREPVVRGDEIVIGSSMTMTLSIDHRVVDGATGAVFLDDLVKLIEDPLSIVV